VPAPDTLELIDSAYTGSTSVAWADYNNDGYLDFIMFHIIILLIHTITYLRKEMANSLKKMQLK